jgi:hypothetical protein
LYIFPLFQVLSEVEEGREQWWKLFSGAADVPSRLQPPTDDDDASAGPACFRSLVVGAGGRALTDWPHARGHSSEIFNFCNLLLCRAGVDPQLWRDPPTQHRILLVGALGTLGHEARHYIQNMDEIIAAVRTEFGDRAEVRHYDPTQHDLTPTEQLVMYRSTTIMFSEWGTIGFGALPALLTLFTLSTLYS